MTRDDQLDTLATDRVQVPATEPSRDGIGTPADDRWEVIEASLAASIAVALLPFVALYVGMFLTVAGAPLTPVEWLLDVTVRHTWAFSALALVVTAAALRHRWTAATWPAAAAGTAAVAVAPLAWMPLLVCLYVLTAMP